MPFATRSQPRVQLQRGAIHYFFVAQKLPGLNAGYEVSVAGSFARRSLT